MKTSITAVFANGTTTAPPFGTMAYLLFVWRLDHNTLVDAFPHYIRAARQTRLHVGYSGRVPGPANPRRLRILDVGCGIHKQPGAIGIDRNPASRADVLCDLDRLPYPFRDNSFDRLLAIHVIEHVADVMATMEEFHRLVRPGGTVRIETPHYTDFSSFCDPTHRSHLNSFSFRYFGEDHGGFGYYTQAKFREISVQVKLLSFWKWLGFEFLVNRFPRYRRFWEHYLCFVVRGKVMNFEFEAIKPQMNTDEHR